MNVDMRKATISLMRGISDYQDLDSTLHLSHIPLMSSLLYQKAPEIKVPKINENTSGRVLMSVQNLKMEEKREKKEAEILLKEQRKLERQQNLREKVASALERQQKQQKKFKRRQSVSITNTILK